MKALILSFFAVILGYSLIFDEKKTTDQPVIKDSCFCSITLSPGRALPLFFNGDNK